MKEIIEESILQSIETKNSIKENIDLILKVANVIVAAIKDGKKVIVFGNGGSAADAQHFATELVCKFEKTRPGIKAIALNTNSSLITATGNDFGFENIFSRQIEVMSDKGDIAFAITTSGNSLNIIKALEKAKEKGLITIALSGRDGGKMKGRADYEIIVRGKRTSRIQETHILIIHILCEIVEKQLFSI